MRFADIRPLAVSLISGGALTLGLISAGLGLPAAAAAATSQCEPLPVPASPSPAASPSAQAELCVTVQASAASVKPGQAASYTVQVAAETGRHRRVGDADGGATGSNSHVHQPLP